MDNSGGRTDLANNVGLYSFNGSNAQKWNFIPVNVGDNTTKYYVSTRALPVAVRSGASDSSSKIGSIDNGGEVDVYNINYSSDYAQVKYNGMTGYVHSEYLFPRKPEMVFDQGDYAYIKYGYASDENERKDISAKISSGGCGVVSIVNAAYYLNGREISIERLAQFAIDNKYRYNGGTKEGLVEAFCNAHGSEYGIRFVKNIKYDGSSANTINKVKPYLQNGNVAVAHVEGHFIALVDYDSRTDKYLILDSSPDDSRGTSSTGYRWLKASDFIGRLGVQAEYQNKNIQVFCKN